MTNKPMLSVERKVIEDILADARPGGDYMAARKVLRALLDEPPHTRQEGYGEAMEKVVAVLEDQSCGACNGCANGCKLDRESPQVEPAAQHQGEPVAWTSPESLGGVRWRPQALDGLADGDPLYRHSLVHPAPLATEAAKAFAKGFNTLESGGGKYRINMQFQSREDAWGAFNALAHLKHLNTPQ